jgi:CBS domain-containing protein
MEDKQIRRVLVVDVAGRLCGVVSQADIARHAPERETGRVVHEVSQPRPNGHVFASL